MILTYTEYIEQCSGKTLTGFLPIRKQIRFWNMFHFAGNFLRCKQLKHSELTNLFVRSPVSGNMKRLSHLLGLFVLMGYRGTRSRTTGILRASPVSGFPRYTVPRSCARPLPHSRALTLKLFKKFNLLLYIELYF